MNQSEFLTAIRANYEKGVELVRKKNADYATNSDPFKNFRSAEFIGLSVEKAILVRILDKLSRVNNLLTSQKTPNVDESIEDTLIDVCNYFNILLVYLQDKQPSSSKDDVPF